MEVVYKNGFVMLIDHKTAITLLILSFLFYKQNDITILPANISLEMEFPNGIKIYKDKEAVEQITHLVNEFSSIWKSLDFM